MPNRRPPLLPADRYLAAMLWPEDSPQEAAAKYERFKAEIDSQVRIDPAEPQAGAALGVIALVSGIISIGLTVAASFFKPKVPEAGTGGVTATEKLGDSIVSTNRVAPRVAFDSIQQPSSLGSRVPVVWARREFLGAQCSPPRPAGEYGGVRVNLGLLWSEIVTYRGAQILRAIFLIGEGSVGLPDNNGWAIGDNSLTIYSIDDSGTRDLVSRATIYVNPNGGPIRSFHRVLGRAPESDKVNSTNYGAANVYDVRRVNQGYYPDFCYVTKPSTSTKFGVYSHCPNGMAFRVNPRLRPTIRITTRSKNNGEDFKVDCEDDPQSLADLWKARYHFSMRSGIVASSRSFAGRVGFVYAGDEFTYRLDRRSDAETKIIFDSTNTDNTEDASNGEAGCSDVASAVSARQRAADDSLIIGELYKVGSALAILIEKTPGNASFISESDNEPVGNGQTIDCRFRVIRDGQIGILAGMDYLDPNWSGTTQRPTRWMRVNSIDELDPPDTYYSCSAFPQIFRCAIASFTLSRAAQVFAIGFASSVGIRVNGFCNLRDCPSLQTINNNAGLSYDGNTYDKNKKLGATNFLSGTIQRPETRISLFKIRYRSESDSWQTFNATFGFVGTAGETILNQLRIEMPVARRWEVQMEPVTSWELRNDESLGLVGGTSNASTPDAAPFSTGPFSVTPSTDAEAMAEALIGPGVTLVPGSAQYTGAVSPNDASGFFYNDTSIFGNPAGSNGVLLTTGSVFNALGPNNSESTTQVNEAPGSDYLDSLVPEIETFDCSTLTFRVTVNRGTTGIRWTYVFASEEYLEYAGSQYNDIFALSLSPDGVNFTNLALIPSTSIPVSINTVNNASNPQYYRDNGSGSGNYDTGYDGLTTVLTATATGLTPGVEYTLKFTVGDASDYSYDSGVFILAQSIEAEGGDYVCIVDSKSSNRNRTDVGNGITVEWFGELRARNRKNFNITSLEPREDVGLPLTDDYSIYDDWAMVAEAFPYNEIQTSIESSPEHEIVYVNTYTENEVFPTYDNLATVGLNIYASTEFNQLAQFSAYISNGEFARRLLNAYTTGSTHLFPDILLAYLTDTRYGRGVLIGDGLVDLPSFVEAADWCQRRRYFYDGVDASAVNLLQWAADVASYSLLELSQRGGRWALSPAIRFPEDGPVPISGLFTAGNIIENTFRLQYVADTERQPIQMSVKWREERQRSDVTSSGFFPVEREVLVKEAFRPDTDPIEPLDLSSFCTNIWQAIDVACYYIRMRRLITHTISFSTTPDGLSVGLSAGSYIQVAVDFVYFDDFSNGVVLQDGTILSTRDELLSPGSFDAVVWDGVADSVQDTTITVDELGKASPTGIVFAMKTQRSQVYTYKVERITISDEGTVDIEAVHHPCDNSGISEIGKNWTSYVSDDYWTIEGNDYEPVLCD